MRKQEWSTCMEHFIRKFGRQVLTFKTLARMPRWRYLILLQLLVHISSLMSKIEAALENSHDFLEVIGEQNIPHADQLKTRCRISVSNKTLRLFGLDQYSLAE